MTPILAAALVEIFAQGVGLALTTYLLWKGKR